MPAWRAPAAAWPPPSTTSWSPTPECGGWTSWGRDAVPSPPKRWPAGFERKATWHYIPCPPLSRGGWLAPIYSLAPHCLSGGRGPRSGEGGIAEGTPGASSRKPEADASRQPIAESWKPEARSQKPEADSR